MNAKMRGGIINNLIINRWLLWAMASLPEGKSWGIHLVQVFARYRQGSATSNP